MTKQRIGRVKGHKRIELESAGERKRIENSWTWVCECGAEQSASTKKEAMNEWGFHILHVREGRGEEISW